MKRKSENDRNHSLHHFLYKFEPVGVYVYIHFYSFFVIILSVTIWRVSLYVWALRGDDGRRPLSSSGTTTVEKYIRLRYKLTKTNYVVRVCVNRTRSSMGIFGVLG